MNLFIAAWDLDESQRAAVEPALRAMCETYPLDDATLGTWSGDRAFASWMHWRPDVLGARRYVHRSAAEVVLLDGTAVDASGVVRGHDASSLSAHWERASELLEGRYAAVRITSLPETLDLVNDPFGLHPLFVRTWDGATWIANNLQLMVRATGEGWIDEAAMASLLVTGFPAMDRTLIEGVSIVPAGQRWCWQGDGSPQRKSYVRPADFARADRRSFDAERAASLATELGALVTVLSSSFTPLDCPITAGRDSRVMTGLMLANGLEANSFTAGSPDTPDVVVGSAIAQRFGLEHRNSVPDDSGLLSGWEAASRRLIARTDGMVTLAHARNALGPVEPSAPAGVQLYGAGGEVARGSSYRLRFVLKRPGLPQAEAEALRRAARRSRLVREERREQAAAFARSAIRELHHEGFPPVDLPDAYYLWVGQRRWAGAQARQIAGRTDVFMPFLTRPYVRATFGTPAIERSMERIPFRLLEHLSPELRRMPGQVPWPSQSTAQFVVEKAWRHHVKLAKRARRRLTRRRVLAAGRPRERLRVLESQLPRWRERFLDRDGSLVWETLDRGAFEFLTSDRSTQRQRTSEGAALFLAATAFTFEEELERWRS